MPSAILKANDNLARMLAGAAAAGCPRDQVDRFVRAGYVIVDGMQLFHAWSREADLPGGPEWIALGGKRGPGKSHTIMAQVGLDDMQRVPGLKVLFLRKIQKAAAESMEDLVRRVFRYVPHTLTKDGVKLSNGSRLTIGGYKDESDIEKYLGLEYDVIVVEECTQISEDKIKKLRGSLRTSKPNWRPRMYLSTNPDGIGLLWFKKMFIEPARAGVQTGTRFLDVTHIRNPFANPEYEAFLDGLAGNLRKAWRDGDWDAFAGMAFPQWNRDLHVVDPFAIPQHWIKWRASDWGFQAPYCTLWAAKDPDIRRIFVYREHYMAGLTDRQQARAIIDLTPANEKIEIHYADPNSYWVRKNKGNVIYTSADEYAAEGVILTPGDDNRIQGVRRVRNIMALLPDGLPGIQWFSTCEHSIEQMSSLAGDENNPEDVDTDQEDHAYDTTRMLLTNEKRLDKKPPRPKENNPMDAYFN